MIQLTPAEQETVYGLAEKILGISQKGKFRKNILVRNIELRISQTKRRNLSEYLNYVNSNKVEYCHFISALTIHTTNWFREPPHFIELEKYLKQNIKEFYNRPFNVLSAACSTGEEVYSLGLLLEKIRAMYPDFEYSLVANDIDPVSVSHAKRSLFPKPDVTSIPKQYHRDLLLGKNQYEDFFTLSKSIRERVTFSNENILHGNFADTRDFDLIFCRNVLIYFEYENITRIIDIFVERLNNTGILCLGHSEALNSPEDFNLKLIWNSSYRQISKEKTNPAIIKPTHDKLKEDSGKYDDLADDEAVRTSKEIEEKEKTILVVDDSVTVRKVLEKLYEKHGFKVLLAEDAEQANEHLSTNYDHIDLISLDLHMPGISGPEWLRQIRERNVTIPVIVITDAHPDEAMEVLGALESGAQDYLNKADLNQDENIVIEKIQAIIDTHREHEVETEVPEEDYSKNIRQTLFNPDLILIGASTGGPEALSKLLEQFDHDSPPILIVQHIAPSFAEPFYLRLCRVSGLKSATIKDGLPLKRGYIYAACGDYHVGVEKTKMGYKLITDSCDPVNRHRPSVDYLFGSATSFADKIAGVLLTGMGADGANGLSELRKRGAITFVQNESSCVVFGMPREAIRRNAHGFVGDISDIRNQMNTFIKM